MNLPKPDRKQTKPSDTAPAWANIGIIPGAATINELIPIQSLSPVALAYIGDAVYELYIRTRLLIPPKRMADYHRQVVAQVRAESQAACLEVLEPDLTSLEKDILRRGRNAAGGKPRRLSLSIYQQASSLETLIGYLYLSNPARLAELLTKLDNVSL